MSKGKRPVCIGMIGVEDDCEVCEWRRECQEMTDILTSKGFTCFEDALFPLYSENQYIINLLYISFPVFKGIL